ncbi:hypothetical protein EGH21_02530 [Halomicroarcula sp. F13]|uniref:Uncharacterized protein n=1 Tax=Haloarcula rubra TaxID=2487747 RepID=A0AAW4PMA8_9EURY|nr:hypothetical protein [Halomicroarcula rubra]MBX0321901.1 hypothetical protein [Halomicroarcula rubra]
MDARTRLESNLAAESEAYGYTLSIWGGGALLVHTFGIPGVTWAMAYVAGALGGFGTLAVLAFRGVSETAAPPESQSPLVASTIHVVATGGTLAAVYLLVTVAGNRRPVVVYLVAGFLATAAYNLLLLLEELAVEEVVE